jgi:methyl-accepting chemotaxis protein/ABC-type sugar transport system substrate-binding protein
MKEITKIKKRTTSLLKKQIIIFLSIALFYVLLYFIKKLKISLPLLLIIFIVNITNFIVFYIFFIKKLTQIKNKITDISSKNNADLTQRLPIKSSDEIGFFSKEINIFIAKIHNIIFKLKNISSISMRLSENLAASTNQSSTAIEEMSANINSITNNGKLLENNLKSSLNDVEEIGTSIINIVDKINSQSTSVNESSAIIEQMIHSIQNITTISNSKIDFIDSLKKKSIESENNMAITIDSIKKVADSASIIKNLVEIINNIASQINILSINAAIQSAHSGKYGKGFSVVAGEIKKLAETTELNSKNISKNLNMIISSIQNAYTTTLETNTSIKNTSSGVQDVSKSLNEIINSLGEISSGTKEITTALTGLVEITNEIKNASNEINTKSKNIHTFINNVVQISSNNTTSLNEINTGMNQILESTSNISDLGTENSNNIKIMVEDISNFNIIDTSSLLSSDGQPLIQWNNKQKEIPSKPENDTKQYPEDDERHWYNIEYAGWNIIKKINIPDSPADGAYGKKIICLRPNHPYQSAYERGMKKIADTFGINLRIYSADYNTGLQEKQINKAIKEKPDMIIINPESAVKCIEWCKKINIAGIPVILSNMTPSDDEGYKYIICWTGPDDWGQCRILAKKFAEFMNYKGNYCCIRHIKGTSNYVARTFSFITELKKIAPEMKCLDMKTTDLDRKKSEETVLEWIEKYGTNLNGIISADDAETLIGANKAIAKIDRGDIIKVGVCHSKAGLDGVKDGKIQAITFQSAEGDGALAVEAAIDWFNGLNIVPIKYLPVHIITKENVEYYYPAQW